jgi:hypothetical protein
VDEKDKIELTSIISNLGGVLLSDPLSFYNHFIKTDSNNVHNISFISDEKEKNIDDNTIGKKKKKTYSSSNRSKNSSSVGDEIGFLKINTSIDKICMCAHVDLSPSNEIKELNEDEQKNIFPLNSPFLNSVDDIYFFSHVLSPFLNAINSFCFLSSSVYNNSSSSRVNSLFSALSLYSPLFYPLLQQIQIFLNTHSPENEKEKFNEFIKDTESNILDENQYLFQSLLCTHLILGKKMIRTVKLVFYFFYFT